MGEHAVEALALAGPAQETQSPGGRHRRTTLKPFEEHEYFVRRGPANRDAAFPQMPRDAGREGFSVRDADDGASRTNVPRRMVVEEGCRFGRSVDDDVDASKRCDR